MGGRQRGADRQDAVRVLGDDGHRAPSRGLFNELYDHEHLPLLLKLPGSINAVRYKTTTAGVPRYLCAYEVENTTLPMSKLWNDTSDIGRWKPEVRPYTYNKRYIVSERILVM